MTEYIIVGDTKEFKSSLISVCGADRKATEEILDRMINNPTETDLALSEGHSNLRIKEVPEEQQWWNDSFLAN